MPERSYVSERSMLASSRELSKVTAKLRSKAPYVTIARYHKLPYSECLIPKPYRQHMILWRISEYAVSLGLLRFSTAINAEEFAVEQNRRARSDLSIYPIARGEEYGNSSLLGIPA